MYFVKHHIAIELHLFLPTHSLSVMFAIINNGKVLIAVLRTNNARSYIRDMRRPYHSPQSNILIYVSRLY